MKTIQQYLKECDREAIANNYIYNYLFNNELMDPRYDEINVGDLKDRMKKRVCALIDRLSELEPETDEDSGILMVIHTSGLNSWDDDDICTILVHESEVLSDIEDVQIYDYSLTPHARMVSFYVADTYLTQHYLNELIIQFLHEAMSMGPEQEHLEAFIEELVRSAEESGKHEYLSFDDVIREMEERFGFQCEVHDKRQEEAENKLIRQRIEYDAVCRRVEIDNLRDAIRREP